MSWYAKSIIAETLKQEIPNIGIAAEAVAEAVWDNLIDGEAVDA